MTSETNQSQKPSKSPVLVRAGTEADVPFIFNSWLKSFQSYVKHLQSPAIYFKGQHELIESLLRRSTVQVAVNPADPSQIYGYAVWETVEDIPVLHYAYTKAPFRRLGIQHALIGKDTVGFCSHYTASGALAFKKLIYSPYLAYVLEVKP